TSIWSLTVTGSPSSGSPSSAARARSDCAAIDRASSKLVVTITLIWSLKRSIRWMCISSNSIADTWRVWSAASISVAVANGLIAFVAMTTALRVPLTAFVADEDLDWGQLYPSADRGVVKNTLRAYSNLSRNIRFSRSVGYD